MIIGTCVILGIIALAVYVSPWFLALLILIPALRDPY